MKKLKKKTGRMYLKLKVFFAPGTNNGEGCNQF